MLKIAEAENTAEVPAAVGELAIRLELVFIKPAQRMGYCSSELAEHPPARTGVLNIAPDGSPILMSIDEEGHPCSVSWWASTTTTPAAQS